MNEQFSKAVKKKLRALSSLAHERELASALAELEREFEAWRKGSLDPFALSERVHTFHDGPGQELYKTYVLNQPEWAVPSAIHRSILTEAEAGPEVMQSLASRLQFLRAQ